jgi:UDP-N-acetylmuramoylalanine--D-glutamate ligase
MFDSAFVDFKENREDFDIIIKTKSGVKSWKITHSVLLGRHNILNILAASLIAARLGVSDDIILSQWEMASSFYKHLPHRLEKIASGPSIFVDHFLKEKKILIVNDSKATNMESTRVAVESFRQPVRLLLGGEPKGDSSFILQKFLNLHLVKIYPFGKAADKIQEDFKNFRNCISDSAQNMLAAANKALNESHENDVILLSPGCSSFDEFKNFEHRGDVFRKWAISHLKENNT